MVVCSRSVFPILLTSTHSRKYSIGLPKKSATFLSVSILGNDLSHLRIVALSILHSIFVYISVLLVPAISFILVVQATAMAEYAGKEWIAYDVPD